MSRIFIGKRVKQVREAEGLNQRDFAASLETSSGYISGVEKGNTMPGGDFLLRMNQVFGTDLTWVLTGAKDGAVVPPGVVLTPDEQVLVDGYRALDAATKNRIMAFVFGGEPPVAKKTKKQVFNKEVSGQVAMGKIINNGGSEK